MFGYVNHHASCYMDSVLVALFVPPCTAWPDVFFSGGGGGGGVRDALIAQLRVDMERLRRGGGTGAGDAWTCHEVRSALRAFARHFPASTAGVDVQSNTPQSAVDFLQFLVRACGVDTQRVTQFQTSTTALTRRPGTEAAAAAAAGGGSSISRLIREWMSVPTKTKWTRDNAHLLTDASERAALQKDARALLSENMEGDVRRVTPPESTCVFLCQLTSADTNAEAEADADANAGPSPINIARQLLPHIETIDAACYNGRVGWKIVAVRLLHAPLLVIEVSRNVTMFSTATTTPRVQKVTTPVSFGVFDVASQQWLLRVHDKVFGLVAVVCHVGGAGGGGHYVSYVRAATGWLFYDDTTPRGEMVPVTASFRGLPPRFPRPAVEGELFFYATCAN